MSNIALIYMGGTFGCVGEPLSPMPEHQFLPHLNSDTCDCFAAPSIKDSSSYTATDWLQLVQFIQEKQKDYDDFIVIHGTDTLSYASAVLARFLAQSCRVIITGSQYPLLNTQGTAVRDFTDAQDNLNFAIQQIKQINKGVYLAFHQQLFHGRTALKVHTTELDAFSGLSTQEIIAFDQTQTITDHDIARSKSLNIANLMMQPIGLEQLEQNLNAFITAPPHFLILQGFGTGNLVTNTAITHILQQLKHHNCLPILTTQVTFGGIDQRYAVSAWVKDAQIITTDTLGHADLYAKILQLYLQYEHAEQWYTHWSDFV
ncbi:asparaginase [Acinetobacter sp. HY1485]|uniref:asparaginase n=1 Tax=Acinetobacter sp. HY1485 TaxID=2970918 RepID=UPI0022B99830|nr:asparaginase [Acinetobacter sp. HY1485]